MTFLPAADRKDAGANCLEEVPSPGPQGSGPGPGGTASSESAALLALQRPPGTWPWKRPSFPSTVKSSLPLDPEKYAYSQTVTL